MKDALRAFLGFSPSLTPQSKALEAAAVSSTPVLILGEPGTGRSTLARALHRAGPRASGPLVEVDPSVIPSTLFESELFGYEAGAFTGAVEAVAGRVERAAGGTLVLDHVEELPLGTQPKLLRLLAEGRYSPLGGQERRSDVRFVAVGSHELPQRLQQGAFREDLYYRLEVLNFVLPPLRQRREDLPLLIRHLLGDLGERYGRPGAELAPESWSWIELYDWPGNLRQLRNVLERALILQPHGALRPPPLTDSETTRPRTLVEAEKAEIFRALAYTRGRQAEAAQLLGISRKALWQKRRRYGIP